jgi:hypothetical protein
MLDPLRAWRRLEQQHALGPRHVGSPGHAQAQRLLTSWLGKADYFREHAFEAAFFGREVTCRTLWGRFNGTSPGRLLLGSHYDTRPWADRDPDPARRQEPVPGANDGASGVALLAELATELATRRDRPTVDIVLFDAEDWHEIDGHEVSLGARRFVEEMEGVDRPDAAIIVDMIAGRDLKLDVDVNCQDHPPSYDLTLSLFRLGHQLGLPAFDLQKEHPYKWIGCDHSPFAAMDIPSAILIDIDYPPWHTVADVPEACAPESMAQIARLLEAYVFGLKVGMAPAT